MPRCVRIDTGTENTMVEDIQMAFRWDHTDDMSAENSVIKGSSHSNQVIVSLLIHCLLLLPLCRLFALVHFKCCSKSAAVKI